MTEEIKKIVDVAVEGIQEKKGKGITIVDLSQMEETICQSFIICEGNSPTQVSAICDSVEEFLRKKLGEKPVRTVGIENSIWVAMDYVDVIVHIFVPDAREYYDLDSMWDDAPKTEVPDLD